MVTEYIIDCQECEDSFESDNEEEALGWMFGHTFRTEHTNISKEEVS